MKRMAFGFVRGTPPNDQFLRCRYLFKMGGTPPSHPRHGRSSVWWVEPDHIGTVRTDGVTIIAAGKGSSDTAVAAQLLAAVDPVVLAVLDGKVSEKVEKLLHRMFHGRDKVVIVIGPDIDDMITMPIGRTKRKRLATVDVVWHDGTPSAESRYL